MKIIIKKGETVFALSLDRADLRALLIAGACAFHLGIQPPPWVHQDLFAGSGGFTHALVRGGSQAR